MHRMARRDDPPRRTARPTRIRAYAGLLIGLACVCLGSLPWSLDQFNQQHLDAALSAPLNQEAATSAGSWILGTDALGRSMLARMLLGGSISLGIGLAAALIATVIGTTWGMLAGYVGGRIDAIMMRTVDVLYGLPYILLVVLLSVAFEPWLAGTIGPGPGNVITLLIAIGAVSWLTLARVVRGQVLSLRAQPFIEAARACGVPGRRVVTCHILPNLVGPIVVYTTLTVPQAILQESFLSFLGIGVQPPMPSWGNLAANGLSELNLVESRWWLLAWPCIALAATLLTLNFLGDALRDRFDPHAAERMT